MAGPFSYRGHGGNPPKLAGCALYLNQIPAVLTNLRRGSLPIDLAKKQPKTLRSNAGATAMTLLRMGARNPSLAQDPQKPQDPVKTFTCNLLRQIAKIAGWGNFVN